ncbi:MAG TPA: hypothetical protein VF847_05900 [Candidatus Deferrimicrobiaceae bacterium]
MNGFDRQFVASLAASAVAGALLLGGVCLFAWAAGFPGLVLLLAIAGGALRWFYRGRRSDLPPSKPAGSGT